MKQIALHVLRKTRLLPVAEAVRFSMSRLLSRAALPATAYDAFGEMDWDRYMSGGKYIAEYLAPLIDGPGRVLEWGCGPARVIRHMAALLPQHEFVGIDCNAESIRWCSENLPGIMFARNQFMPPTDFPDGHFDFIYTISVFTHLAREAHFAWASELLRLLKPGGRLICSLHGNSSTQRLLPFELAKYEAGELVIRDNVAEGTRCFVAYHPDRFVRELLRDFSIERHDRAPNRLSPVQDVWIARRPA